MAALGVSACASTPRVSADDARAAVAATERAFAATMARRDFAAFQTFIADDAVFFAGEHPLRGKAAVAAHWQRYFREAAAPFAWEPATVEVLARGDLALSSGPVRDASGKTVAVFNSIWQRQPSGEWRIVFDKGGDHCRPGE